MKNYSNYDLFDLISERHLQLRTELEEKWNATSTMSISNAEWYIMSKIKNEKVAMAQVAKSVHTSRQATHKLLKKMAQKNLVVIADAPQNKKEKQIYLTAEALEYFAQYEALKREMMGKVETAIGQEAFTQLVQLLMLDWTHNE